MDGNLNSNIDVVAGGDLIAKTIDSTYELLEDTSANNDQWLTERTMNRKIARIHEIDVITALIVQVALYLKNLTL